ncbi:MAG: GNAT family N-acetyltransferase [Candidatus Gorgyraea atricola]|nr:GNAT family N-acetyltransferase [Candidatus Gorgyraea atricola]
MTDLVLRKIEQSDREDLFSWRNDKTTRGMSFNKNYISIEKHNIWFERVIADSNRVFYIGEIKPHRKIGVIRFDKTKEGCYEISINLALQYRGQGLGKVFIREACIKLINEKTVKEIAASVKTENTSSVKSFNNAGFTKIEEKNGVTKMHFSGETA